MSKCAVESCDRPTTARGWCNGHYKRWHQSGDVDADTPLGRKVGKGGVRTTAKCTVADCEKVQKCRGWCENHYMLWRNHGDPLHKRANSGACSIDGCARKAQKVGICQSHLYRIRRDGDPLVGGPLNLRRKSHPSHSDGTCVCTRCDQTLPLSAFTIARSRRSGHVAHCRRCDAAQRAADPDKSYESSRRRRATLRKGGGDVGITRASLRLRDGDLCAYCKVPLDFASPRGRREYRPNFPSLDHVLPISRGGLHIWTNVVLACMACNLQKRDRIAWTEWLPRTS